jgi:ribose transport system ATP-binding protein
MALISHMSGRQISEKHVHNRSVTDEKERQIALEAKVHLKEFNKDVELKVAKGEFIGIAGLDGQGQTTLLRSLFGMYGGISVKFYGKELYINAPGKAIKNGIAFLSGNRETEGTFKERSIAENFDAVNKLVLKKEQEKDVDACLRLNGVKYNNCRDLITSLSGGNQQKVVIARWTYTGAKFLLADDPTKGIDVQARKDVHETFFNMIENGASIIMISSDDEELVETSKMMPMAKIIVMYEGSIASVLTGNGINLESIAASSSGQGMMDMSQPFDEVQAI